jgi:hypothetical protein
MVVRLYLAGERVGVQFAKNNVKNKTQMLSASRGAAEDVVKFVETKGRADIANAGKFGARWTQGFRGKVTEGGGNIRVAFTMPDTPPMKHWRVFQFGATIRGKPMLWIPLPFAKDAQGVRARDYPGRLFRVNREGKAPLLLAAGKPAVPKYFGKSSVRIPKKFHLIEIIRQGSAQMKNFYNARFKPNG